MGVTPIPLQGTIMNDPELTVKTKNQETIQEPPLFKIIYINDNITVIEFVIASLIAHFDYSESMASQIAQDVHQQGSAVVAVLPYEIAEQKGVEISFQARNEGYPLQIKIEPDIN